VRTSDVDEARERVGRVFCEHKLECLSPGRALDMRQHVARFGNLAFSYIGYGTDVSIDPGKLSTFFLVHLIPSGRSEIHIGDSALVGSSAVGAVTSSTTAMRMRWSADCAHLVLKIERAALERHLCDLLGDTAALPVETGLGAGLRRLIEFVTAELDRDDTLLASPLGIAGIEQMLMTALLAAQPSNYSAALAGQGGRATPRHVMRAEELIRSHPERPITVGDLAKVSGVSARTLFEGFRRFPRYDADGAAAHGAARAGACRAQSRVADREYRRDRFQMGPRSSRAFCSRLSPAVRRTAIRHLAQQQRPRDLVAACAIQ
jgi:hypothetical protein